MKRLIIAVLPLAVIFFAACAGNQIQDQQLQQAIPYALKSHIQTPKQESAKFKEIAQYHFQQGQKVKKLKIHCSPFLFDTRA